MIIIAITGYIAAIMFALYGKYKVENKFWYIRGFFYIASACNIACSTFLTIKYLL